MLLFSSTIAIFLDEKSLTMETESNVLIDTPIFCHDLSTIQEQTKKKISSGIYMLIVGGGGNIGVADCGSSADAS